MRPVLAQSLQNEELHPCSSPGSTCSPLPPALCSVRSARSKLRHARDGAGDQPKHAAVQQPGQFASDPVPGDLLTDGPPAPLAAATGAAEKHRVPGAATEASQRR